MTPSTVAILRVESLWKIIGMLSILGSSLAFAPATYIGEKKHPYRAPSDVIGTTVTSFLDTVRHERNREKRTHRIVETLEKIRAYGHLLIEDSTVWFLFSGNAGRVTVPSDLNSWNSSADPMERIPGTNLFFLGKHMHPEGRFEYKLVVDSAWILDPLNAQQSMGGYGANSEVWMPGYVPPDNIHIRENLPRGIIDTIRFKSTVLKRTHTVYVYLPHGHQKQKQALPSVYVTDGGEYLSLAAMNTILDNLIADGRIMPVIGVFIDPRTNPSDSRTSTRAKDYTMSDPFVRFLKDELRPALLAKYRLSRKASETAIIGASLGGLIATYASIRHPKTFGLCAAQSPSYWWNNKAMINLVRSERKKPIRLFLHTGTINDAEKESRLMKTVLEEKRYDVRYVETPEAHNWMNWQGRIDDMLVWFWGTRR